MALEERPRSPERRRCRGPTRSRPAMPWQSIPDDLQFQRAWSFPATLFEREILLDFEPGT
jgi:hypothetical protein